MTANTEQAVPVGGWCHIVQTEEDGRITLIVEANGSRVEILFTERQAKDLAIRLLRGT